MKKFFYICLVSLLLFSLASSATTLYVTTVGSNANDGLTPATAKLTIQAAINAAAANDSIYVADGVYNEDVTIGKTIKIEGQSQFTFIKGLYATTAASVSINAANVTLRKVTVTRDYGADIAAWYASPKNIGLLIAAPGAVIDEVVVNGNRNGIYINNVQNYTVSNSSIEDNRTGFQLANNVSGGVIKNNYITNNFTHGILFNYDNGVLIATNTKVTNNYIVGNWYSQVTFLRAGATPAGNGLGDHTGFAMNCNWYGAVPPTVTNTATLEPGYGAQAPSQFGGFSPGVPAYHIWGLESSHATFLPYLYTNNDGSANMGYQPVATCSAPVHNVTKETWFQTIQSAIDAVSTTNGDSLYVEDGIYNESVNVSKSIKLAGQSSNAIIRGLLNSTALAVGNGASIYNFTITRNYGADITEWNTTIASQFGVSIAGYNVLLSGLTVRDHRTGVFINTNNPGSINFTIENSIISNNRTGLQLGQNISGGTIKNCYIQDNFTHGVLFNYDYGLMTFTNFKINNNFIANNWYSQVNFQRTIVGPEFAEGDYTGFNMRCNWYGATPPLVNASTLSVPGFTSQTPSQFGGIAPAPSPAQVYGVEAARGNVAPYLSTGVDASGSVGFQPAGSCTAPVHNVTKDNWYVYLQAAINAASTTNGDSLFIKDGIFNEDITVSKSLRISGQSTAAIIQGLYGTTAASVSISAANVTLHNLTVTRDYGADVAAWYASPKNIGLIIAANNAKVDGVTVTGNRNGVYINNIQNFTIVNSTIEKNRTGFQIANNISNGLIQNNFIQDNFTHGILLNYDLGVLTATNTVITNNSITGNWVSQVTFLRAPATPAGNGLGDHTGFSVKCNWYNDTPRVTTAATTDPSYASQIPSQFGGTAPPASTYSIWGLESGHSVHLPYLATGADASGDAGFQTVANCTAPVHNVTKDIWYLSVQAAINAATTTNGDSIYIANGIYNEDVDINKSVKITGQSTNATIRGLYAGSANSVAVSEANVTLRNVTVTRDYGASSGTWYASTKNQGLIINANNVTIDGVLVTGNRNGVYINNRQNVRVINSTIEANRTGLQLANNISNLIVKNNYIQNNFTHGILFNYDNGVFVATNAKVENNYIVGNWHSQASFQRTIGGAGNGLGDHTGFSFNCNWFNDTPRVTTAATAEPGYGAQLPSQFGGTAPPASTYSVWGLESGHSTHLPYLSAGTDASADAGFQTVAICTAPVHNVTKDTWYLAIQPAINAATTTAGDSLYVSDGIYNEDVDINKALKITGASPNAIIRGLYSGSANSVNITAAGATLRNITVTRDFGASAASWYASGKNQGISINANNVTLDGVVVTGNRNGVYINNRQNITVKNSTIELNRTGFQLANNFSGVIIKNNFIQNNLTHGVLFNYDNGVVTAINTKVINNYIVGNWYSQLSFQRTIGPAGNGLGDHTGFSVSCNWYGVAPPVTTSAATTEPGYGAQLPPQFGGVAPAAQSAQLFGAEVGHAAGMQWLTLATDTDPIAAGFQETTSCTYVHNVTQNTYHTTIQPAIDAAVNGDSLYVIPSSYPGYLTINKSIILAGPNHNVSGCNTRSAEAIIQPDGDSTGVSVTAPLIAISASNVKLKGFQIDGANAAVVGAGKLLNGTQVFAKGAIGTVTASNPSGIVLENNIVQNFFRNGIQAAAPFTPISTNNVIRGNKIDNIPSQYAIFLQGNFYGLVENNCITRTWIGASIYNFGLPNSVDTPIMIKNNTITTYGAGLLANNNFTNSGTVSSRSIKFESNTIDAADRTGWSVTGETLFPAPFIGIIVSSSQGSQVVNVLNNTVSNAGIGVSLWNNPSNAVVINNHVSTNNDTAIISNNMETTFGFGPAAASTIYVNNLTSTGGTAGVVMIDNPANAGNALTKAVITGGSITNASPIVSNGDNASNVVSGTALNLPATGTAVALKAINTTGGIASAIETGVDVSINLNANTTAQALNIANGGIWKINNPFTLPATPVGGLTSQVSHITTIAAGVLSLNGQLLKVGGNITNAGTINGAASSMLLNGTSLQTIAAGNFIIDSLVASNDAIVTTDNLTVVNVLDVNNGKTLNANGHVVLKSDATKTARVAQLDNDGGGAVTGDITVERFVPATGRSWRLLTIPVTGNTKTIRDAWCAGQLPINSQVGAAAQPVNNGTLITGHNYTSGSLANTASYDWWGLVSGGASSIRKYVISGSTGSWPSATGTPNLNTTLDAVAEGYMLFIRGDRQLASNTGFGSTTLKPKGLLKSGTRTYTIPAPVTALYHIIGNPYASPLDIDNVFSNGSNSTVVKSDRFWTWDASNGTNGGYYLIKKIFGTWTRIPSPFDDQDAIEFAKIQQVQSGQAILLESNTGGSFEIKEEDKSAPVGVLPPIFDIIPEGRLYTNLNLVDGQAMKLADGFMTAFSARYSKASTDDEDVRKVDNFDENIAGLANGNRFSIEGRPQVSGTDTLLISASNLKQRSYALRFKAQDMQTALVATLEDMYLGTKTNIQLAGEVTTYGFTVNSDPMSSAASRFKVVFEGDAPLSLEMTAKARVVNNGVQVDWTAQNEQHVKEYVIEKAVPGSSFKASSTVASKGLSLGNYGWFDASPFSGDNFYRIKSIGVDGKVKYSNVLKLKIGQSSAAVMSLYPNPVTGGAASMQLDNVKQGRYTVSVYNAAGELMQVQTIQHDGGSASQTIILPKAMAAGIYKVTLTGAETNLQQTIAVQ